jgi:hypothetical protein
MAIGRPVVVEYPGSFGTDLLKNSPCFFVSILSERSDKSFPQNLRPPALLEFLRESGGPRYKKSKNTEKLKNLVN